MSEPMVTRAELKDQDMTVPWMLVSGQDIKVNDLISRKQKGMILYVNDGSRTTQVPMDVHEAGELYAALEAHMENVAEAQPITPEERDRLLRKDRIRKGNLEAVKDEIARPLFPKGDPAEAVRRLWIDGPSGKAPEVAERTIEIIRSWFPQLADALDDLANGGPS
jgi:hypothetical protein